MGIEELVNLATNENIQKGASSIFGMLFPYTGIKKLVVDTYQEEIKKSNLPAEIKLVLLLNAKRVIKKLKNRKDIADKAFAFAKEGTNFDKSSGVSEEWLERFMDSAGFVSEEQLQIIWAKVLSKEFEAPGSTPPSVIRILSEITPKYAQAFQKICSMKRILAVIDSNGDAFIKDDVMIPYDDNNRVQLASMGLSFETLNELDTIGLIKFKSSGFFLDGLPETGIFTYINGVTKEIAKYRKDDFPAGSALLTNAGKCLEKIIQPEAIPNYESMEKQYMLGKGVIFKEPPEYSISENDDGTISVEKTSKA